jgi:hypothetical protein
MARAFSSAGYGSPVRRAWLTKRSRLSSSRESTRNEIAGDQLDDVAGYQLVDRHREAYPVAPYGRLDRHRPAQRLDRILSADFLDEIKCHADRDDGQDDEKARDVAGRRGQPARHKQDDHQRVAKAGEELLPKRRTLDGCGVVGSVGRQPQPHLCGIKARGGRRESREKPVCRLLPDFVGAKFALCGVHGAIVMRPAHFSSFTRNFHLAVVPLDADPPRPRPHGISDQT